LVPVDKISPRVLFRSVRTSPRISFPAITRSKAKAAAAIAAADGSGGTPTLMYACGAPSTSTVPISAVAASAAGTAMASPSGSQINPVIAARAASGIAIATRGTATIFAGTLVSETVPNVGSSIGSVAS
jgi:hypothetical protein